MLPILNKGWRVGLRGGTELSEEIGESLGS
jgi:hypothetical protein